MPPSSDTNSFAATKRSSEFREGKFPASWFTPPKDLRRQKSAGRTCNTRTALRQRDFLKSFLASQQEEFLTTFLLAHCGGGQDKPGCLGPSAKLPRHCFFVAIRIWYHFHSPLIRGCFALAVSSVFETSRLAGISSAPRYLCAACTCGQEISIALVGEDGGSPADARLEAGEFKPCGEEFECIEKRDAAPF